MTSLNPSYDNLYWFCFNDILVFSHSLANHLGHLWFILGVLHAHQLYAKESKCKFGVAEIDYLGHLISTFRVRVDSSKLEALGRFLFLLSPCGH